MPLCSQCPVPDLYKVPNIFLVHERMDDEMPHHTLNEVRFQPHMCTINSR